MTNKRANGSVIDEYTYTYDNAHNQKTKVDPKEGTTSYDYDKLNRLEKVTEPNGRVTAYAFDRAGNRQNESILSGSLTQKVYSYDDKNRLTNITTATNGLTSSIAAFGYDNNGNQLTSVITPYAGGIPQTPKENTNTYDALNQLITTTIDRQTVTNTYNGEGLRVGKNGNGQDTRYLYEYDKVILELDGQGSQTAMNVYGTNLLQRQTQGQTAYYMYNGHGDVTALIGTGGQELARYSYDAFGNILKKSGSISNPIRYAGYQYDEETGMYYLNARMYDPVTARFMQEDTYRGSAEDPLSLNLYTYCHNEPVMYDDPTGHERADVERPWKIDRDRPKGSLGDYDNHEVKSQWKQKTLALRPYQYEMGIRIVTKKGVLYYDYSKLIKDYVGLDSLPTDLDNDYLSSVKSTYQMTDAEFTNHYKDFSPVTEGAGVGNNNIVDLDTQMGLVQWDKMSPEDAMHFLISFTGGQSYREATYNFGLAAVISSKAKVNKTDIDVDESPKGRLSKGVNENAEGTGSLRVANGEADAANYMKLKEQLASQDPMRINAERVKANGYGKEMERFSGGYTKVYKADGDADLLAQRLGGTSRVRFTYDPKVKEFDTISTQYIAETKPYTLTVNKDVREQMIDVFEASLNTGKTPYFHYEGGQPSQEIINQIAKYEQRYGIKAVIDSNPLK